MPYAHAAPPFIWVLGSGLVWLNLKRVEFTGYAGSPHLYVRKLGNEPAGRKPSVGRHRDGFSPR